MFILAQSIGFVALILAFGVYQTDNRKRMLILQFCAATLFAVHFALLWVFTAVAMNLLGAIRNYLFLGFSRNKLLPIAFVFMFAAAVVMTWEGPKSVLPGIGMISGTIAMWQVKPKNIRLLALISPPAWFIYNFLVMSYPGMLMEVFLFTSTLLGMYRLDLKRLR